ncbi:inorganic phosphate transporter [Spirochaeta isovalerica]|uniref:PiT family inorganic phosphate transporter n=1 Tax=Spirochaeta isovalerica TaxID=150 RepID=A0A841RDX2_9SPIO|nr:inorganic phosphate transporter [Spirochaeta isovalerica]MBB6482183.1 PiT family inorganic phosphate transporter [Spirochaeta isovalerica]
MITILIFLSSGLFLGWSLGANDAANVWGTAVGTRMIKFKSAALICSVFVILGAVISGAGASHTLGKLGAINELAGAFTVALSAALSVFWMTKAALPVSTSQAVVGAIIGWNLFSQSAIDMKALTKVMGTWVFSPVLSAIVAAILYFAVLALLKVWKIHLIRLDGITRVALLAAGAFGSYSLGANNIANVMGVFVESASELFTSFNIGSVFTLTGVQQLFFLGGAAIAVGVYTYSKRVMMTVGSGIYHLSPITAFVVVLASSIVLFLFASKGLKEFLVSNNLPSFPLVPVSSSQSIVGAVIGVGLAKGGRNLNLKVLGRISLGWVATPLIAAVVAFVALFIVQNVFGQIVF